MLITDDNNVVFLYCLVHQWGAGSFTHELHGDYCSIESHSRSIEELKDLIDQSVFRGQANTSYVQEVKERNELALVMILIL